MDRDERIQWTAAIIASGLCANPKCDAHGDLDHALASRAVAIALRIEAEGYGGFEPVEDTAKRFAEEYAKTYGQRGNKKFAK